MNENVLAGVRCPKCGCTEHFEIVATCCVTVTDDYGVIEVGDYHWEAASDCTCPDCDYFGKYREFLEDQDA